MKRYQLKYIFFCILLELSGIFIGILLVKNNKCFVNIKASESAFIKNDSDNLNNEWENMFNFLHMNSHSLCEDIFTRQDKGSNYTNEVTMFYDIMKGYNYIVNNISRNYGKGQCREGFSARLQEETYVMWSLARY